MSKNKEDETRGNFVVDLVFKLKLNKAFDTYVSDENINSNTKKAVDKIIRALIDEIYKKDNIIDALIEEVDYYEKEDLYYQEPSQYRM